MNAFAILNENRDEIAIESLIVKRFVEQCM